MSSHNPRRGRRQAAARTNQSSGKPLSRITAADLKELDLPVSLNMARWLAKKGTWAPSRWNSTGAFKKATKIYEVQSLKTILSNLPTGIFQELSEEYANQSNRTDSPAKRTLVTGEYAQWSNSKPTNIVAWVKFSGELDDKGWIHLPDGSRRRANGHWIRFQEKDQAPPTNTKQIQR